MKSLDNFEFVLVRLEVQPAYQTLSTIDDSDNFLSVFASSSVDMLVVPTVFGVYPIFVEMSE